MFERFKQKQAEKLAKDLEVRDKAVEDMQRTRERAAQSEADMKKAIEKSEVRIAEMEEFRNDPDRYERAVQEKAKEVKENLLKRMRKDLGDGE